MTQTAQSGTSTQGSTPTVSAPAVNPSAPSFRSCCVIGFSPVLDVTDLGVHRYGGKDKVGLIFTRCAGFMDLGHIRDNIDNTKYYFDVLRSGQNRKDAVFHSIAIGARALVGINRDIQPSEFIAVARSMAYDDSVYHEIDSWDVPIDHNSAFSPEDLPSNHLGTYVAARALKEMATSGKTFEDQVTTTLNDVLTALQPVPPSETWSMVDAARTRGWIIGAPDPKTAFDRYKHVDYLFRRNFDTDHITPWFPYEGPPPPMPPDLTHSWGTVPPQRPYVTAYMSGESPIPWVFGASPMSTVDFPAQIATIKTKAAAKYGPNFDKP